MIDTEWKAFAEKWLKAWKYTDGEIEVMWQAARNANAAQADIAMSRVIATREDTHKLPAGVVTRLLMGGPVSTEVQSNEPPAPEAMRQVYFKFLKALSEAKTASQKRKCWERLLQIHDQQGWQLPQEYLREVGHIVSNLKDDVSAKDVPSVTPINQSMAIGERHA